MIIAILDDYKLGTREEKRREELSCMFVAYNFMMSLFVISCLLQCKDFSCLSFSLKDWIREG